MKRVFLALIVPAIALLAWQYAATSSLISAAYFPAPTRTLSALFDSAAAGQLWKPFGATASRMVQGWAVACITGVGLGALIGSSKIAEAYLSPLLEFLRPFPASAIIPAAILVFGLSQAMAIWVIAFGSLWPTLIAALHGFANISPRLKEVAQTLEMPKTTYLRKIAIPAALPDTLTGVRISLSIALILAIVVEMQAAQPGLGQNILLAQRMFRSPELYAGIIVLGIFGVAISVMLDWLERVALPKRAI